MPRSVPERRLNRRPSVCGAAPLNRRGVILVIVLIVIAVLSLAAYHYTDMMTAEFSVATNSTRAAQARAAADSAVNYCLVALSTPDNLNNTLNGCPFNNPDVFQGQAVKVFN